MDDREIVELYWQRSDRAIAETAARYSAYCHTIAENILHDPGDAEECVNDTWLRAWNSMPDQRPERLRPYLGRLTRWLSLERRRKDGRLKRGGGDYVLALEELDNCLASSDSTERQIETKELAAAIDRFLAALAAEERRVFLARYWFACPIRTIAERRGFSEAKVKTMLHRTRRKLRQHLQKEGYL